MRKRLLAVILCASMMFPVSASAEVLGYEATLNTYTQEKKSPQQFQIDDGEGNTVMHWRRQILFMSLRRTLQFGPIQEKAEQNFDLFFWERNSRELPYVITDGVKSHFRKTERTRLSVMFRIACSVIRKP